MSEGCEHEEELHVHVYGQKDMLPERTWVITSCFLGSDEERQFLADGWEPYAAVSPEGVGGTVIHFRRHQTLEEWGEANGIKIIHEDGIVGVPSGVPIVTDLRGVADQLQQGVATFDEGDVPQFGQYL